MATFSAASFSYTPEPVSYNFIYENSPNGTERTVSFGIVNFSEGMAVRVQLKEALPDGAVLRYDYGEAEIGLLDDGFWMPDDKLSWSGESYVNTGFYVASKSEYALEYTVGVYASRDLAAAPLATISQTMRFRRIGGPKSGA